MIKKRRRRSLTGLFLKPYNPHMNKEELRNLDIDSIKVELPVLFGIKPRIYITIIYSLLILTALFFLLLFPGLKHNGSRVYLNSSMSGSAVYVDGKYIGSTPGRYFIAKGTREIRVSHPCFADSVQKTDIKGRLFFSLFAPKNASLSFELKLEDPQALFDKGLQETASWGLINAVSESYQPRPVISETAAGLVHSGNLALAESFIHETLVHVSNEYMFRDWLHADSIVAGNRLFEGNMFSARAMFDFFGKAELFPNLYYLLYYISGNAEERTALRKSGLLQQIDDQIMALENPDTTVADKGGDINLNGLHFIHFAGGSFVSGNGRDNHGINYRGTVSHPVKYHLDDFYILDREVTRGMFRRFLESNPKWQKNNTAGLTGEGLVTEHYLAGWEDGKDNEPADYVSWYAADAFCQYLNIFLPARLHEEGYRIKLPSENQWEYTALKSGQDNPVFQSNNYIGPLPVNGRTADANGIYDLKGNLWEWCGDWYAPAVRFYSDMNGNSPVQLKGGAEKNVRGGSWANPASEIMPATRASQPPSWCTPYLGFRLVISRD
ncbi:MAG: SUMF1/EgtB/PvdO family nonheme iron enzyme [Spirochaetales bacterium]|nr:SUMF1/EgtB/PvdO family nonheme iron enzyme [Spirochaetales bacterium]